MRFSRLILVPILIFTVFSCKDNGASSENETLITLKNPPAEGTNLPASFQYELDYTIAEADYNADHVYKIIAFMWTDAAPYSLGEKVLEGASGTISLDLPFPSGGIPLDVLIPYRLYFTLADTTAGEDLFTSEKDLIYNEMYVGTWYQMGTKVFIENTSSIRYDYDFGVGYVPNTKGYHQRVSHNGYQNGFYLMNGILMPGVWKPLSEPSDYTLYLYLNTQGDLEVKEDDGTLFQLLTSDENKYTYVEDYCGKWWSGSVKIEDGDSGLILWLSDSYFDTTRDNQHNGEAVEYFPDYEKGTVSVNGNAMVLQVTHEYDGSEYKETDTGKTYKFDFTYSTSGEDPELLLELTDENQANGFSGFDVAAGDLTFEW